MALLIAALALSSVAHADTFPAKPVRLVVHDNPGSALDLIAHQVGLCLTDGWKQPVVIDIKAGA